MLSVSIPGPWIGILFVCHYWQWPILINCVMCYYLCVLRWLMRPILALNCLLQIEQERSEEERSVGDALALAFRCARFCSASLILFASYSPAPLFMNRYKITEGIPLLFHFILFIYLYFSLLKGVHSKRKEHYVESALFQEKRRCQNCFGSFLKRDIF